MTNNSKVLALKYRPQIPEDLIGQEVVIETIVNGIKSEKTPNAYLFTGIRGVGKTTLARIVAKALNCKNGIEGLSNYQTCENCTCKSIADSNHIDILEMDAASKTGVDDIRDLIEFSRYGPTSAKFKIFIIDEVHMLSKQAFNALLKTLEEPPSYLKFIFATTEIKKIPVTVVSRCQRFDLSRIQSDKLFNYLKDITLKEKGLVSEDALKLIVKISEGSVRDSLSLLDRGLMSNKDSGELTLEKAQKIFGYFDKSFLIELIEYLFKGDEKKVIESYRKSFDAGIDPKLFLNDFLEVLYYIQNINSISLGGTNIPKHSLNLSDDKQNTKIDKSVEMVNQIKNVAQEDQIDPKLELDKKKTEINSFQELLNFCNTYKEVQLKYELETNVNLVSFENCRMEISFNDKLDKDFIKELSNKLFLWTNNRWIITLSKKRGEVSVKEKNQINQKQIFEKVKKSNIYKQVLEILPDAELVDVKKIDKESND